MVFQKQTLSDPALPFYIFKQRKRVSGMHKNLQNWHENIELLFVTAGSGEVSIDEDTLPLQARDIAVINSGRIHRVIPKGEGEFCYYVLIVDRSFCLQNCFDSSTIRFDHCFRDSEMSGQMERFIHWYDLPEDTPARVQCMRSAALNILSLLLERHRSPDDAPPRDTPRTARIKRALEFLHAQCHRDISLAEAATFVNLSKYHFLREFKRCTGFGFVDYLSTLRCENAKRLLTETDLSVAAVGEKCGFSSRSYFTRVFTVHTGRTPAAYKKDCL